jgi:hypothetical protein
MVIITKRRSDIKEELLVQRVNFKKDKTDGR